MAKETGLSDDLTDWLHDVLGVEPGASRDELRTAYGSRMRSLVGPNHGDSLDPGRRTIGTVLALAYDVLTKERTDSESDPDGPSGRAPQQVMLPPPDNDAPHDEPSTQPGG